MTITQIEESIITVVSHINNEHFVFDFLLAYGEPKASITRLKNGDLNQLETKGELLYRKKLFFKQSSQDLYNTIDTLKQELSTQKDKPRFIVATNYSKLLAYDIKTENTLDINIDELAKHFDFFLPLAGIEKAKYIDENPADVKASLKMAKLYDEILKTNKTKSKEEIHTLNIFLTRLLFCYFAEDSNIFEDNLFTQSISSYTQIDGSDVDKFLARLFELFNTSYETRPKNLSTYLTAFPYVNGGLFKENYPIPKFTTKSRNILLELGKLDWSQINPDIFGSMIQAVVSSEHRSTMGMHYTSVPNIMKVIQPLFLDELYEELEKAKGDKNKLYALLKRVENIKIFDPACGSGNFLIIAYKELRIFEIKILFAIDELSTQKTISFSGIKLNHFYGIELDDFAKEVAILSLWLAEHQMNLEFYKAFGRTTPALPLDDGGNIICGNATRIKWEDVCPKNKNDEIYILGNPPYLGSRNQNKEQKDDMKIVFQKDYKNLDYISCWFYLGAKYIKGFNSKFAFVSTNSICQGEQVALLWPRVLEDDLEICFAHQSFKWQNNAKANAGVTVVIIGLSNIKTIKKYLYLDRIRKEVFFINAYLISGSKIIVQRNNKSLSNLPNMPKGNMPYDGGNLLLSPVEKDNLINSYPSAKKFIKKLVGAKEFIDNIERYCLWILDNDLKEANEIPEIKKRIELVKKMRLSSTDISAHKLAKRPHQFRETNETLTHSIVVPLTTSERREYIPIGFLSSDYIITNAASVIYNAEPWIFGLLSSKMHMIWVKAVGGSLETRIRYSSVLCYNTFPFPNISQKQKKELEELVFNILDEREKHSEKTLAQLYDPNKMPQGLKKAHSELDLAIDKCYKKEPFKNDEERLEYLFKLYEKMTSNEK